MRTSIAECAIRHQWRMSPWLGWVARNLLYIDQRTGGDRALPLLLLRLLPLLLPEILFQLRRGPALLHFSPGV